MKSTVRYPENTLKSFAYLMCGLLLGKKKKKKKTVKHTKVNDSFMMWYKLWTVFPLSTHFETFVEQHIWLVGLWHPSSVRQPEIEFIGVFEYAVICVASEKKNLYLYWYDFITLLNQYWCNTVAVLCSISQILTCGLIRFVCCLMLHMYRLVLYTKTTTYLFELMCESK